ncbi:alpha-hydroxy acid oxidase [Roseomonas sp. BN140053]|uniref:alpha-hydroxy acid oxidase n=1 Tax=Roseomonas sp. BN140053 TaxID=3391898 RepID=UPI0039EC8DBA
MDPRRILTLEELEPAVRRHLPRGVYTFVSGGAESGAAQRAQRAAFASLALQPRVLRDVSVRQQAVELFGERYTSPFGVAPMGGMALCARDADLLLARAATAEGVPFVLSGVSCVPMERIAEEAPRAWYQGYLPADRLALGRLLDRVGKAGLRVLVVTADVPLAPNREDCARVGFGVPLRVGPRLALDSLARPRWLFGTLGQTLLRDGVPRYENMEAERGARFIGPPAPASRHLRAALDWEDLDWLRRRWPGPLVVKGVLSPDDARRARDAGADGIVVSSHGGRQLDHAVAPLRVLPAICREAGEMTVLLDGGIRRGTEVLKALALGARAVLVGRPMLYATALAGEVGARRAIAILRAELDRDLGLLGRADVAEVGRDCVVPADLDPLAEPERRPRPPELRRA